METAATFLALLRPEEDGFVILMYDHPSIDFIEEEFGEASSPDH